MHIHVHATTELEARPAAVCATLLDEHTWATLMPGLERLGQLWCFQGELYTLDARATADQLLIETVCVGVPNQHVTIEAQLEDTNITTRLHVTLTGNLPFRAGRRARRSFERLVQQATAMVNGRFISANQPAFAKSPSSIEELAERYPNTIAAFTAMRALEHLERIVRMDSVWAAIRQPTTDNRRPATDSSHAVSSYRPIVTPLSPPPPYDLIYAGGGLGLLHAAVMAQQYHKKVLLFDRGEVGCAHREWNISRVELQALVDVGLFTWDELQPVIMNKYKRGIVRFHDDTKPSTDLWLPAVLNVALDAGMLLRLARRKLEAAGGTVLDLRVFKHVSVSERGPIEVCVEIEGPNGLEAHRGRLLLDGMGSISPLALQRFQNQPFAGVCPTVGTVVRGLAPGGAPDEHNPAIGDILLSIEHAQRGQQYMWEGFPGRDDELTVYLFYYDTMRNQGPVIGSQNGPTPISQHQSLNLMQLFEDYFALLACYKKPGPDFQHVKPVYGYIPARHSVRPQEAPLLRGVLSVGDSAAQQSPLTFCGFGSHVRNLDRTTSLVNEALERNLLEPQHLQAISAYQINVSLNWVFSRFMQPWSAPDSVNKLQNIFLGVLNDLGIELAERFFQDRMRWSDYHKMVLGMFFRHPQIVLDAWQVLGFAGCRQWAADYVRYSGAALLAWASAQFGSAGRATLAELLDRVQPAFGLRARAAFAEWRASGWLS